MKKEIAQILWFDQLNRSDGCYVGGKNSSLGELIAELQDEGIPVPTGFATTARAYWDYVDSNNLRDLIALTIERLTAGKIQLADAGRAIRNAFVQGDWPAETAQSILEAYGKLGELTNSECCSVAVRSSATAEDLPEASFAGQQESFLNIQGEQALLDACKRCYASLFTDRAIMYRRAKGFDHSTIAVSVGVQKMVRADTGSSGVMFSIDTETGFDKVVVINAAWGLGENIVQGIVDPDEYQVFKPLLKEESCTPIIEKKLGSKEKKLIFGTEPDQPTYNVDVPDHERKLFALTDQDILSLARWACLIERHYQCAMDIEWAKDGDSGELYVVQARPETVQSQKAANIINSYHLTGSKEKIVSGLAIGQAVVSAKVCNIPDISEIDQFVDGSILVTENTNPDWVPIMKRAAAIVTNHGGRTSHSAIVSRELGVPAIIGTGNGTQLLSSQSEVTVSCAEGDEGHVYQGRVEFTMEEIDLGNLPTTETEIMVNLANPAAASRWWHLPADGVGLVRMEFIVSDHIKIHPMALVNFDAIEDENTQRQINKLTDAYTDKAEFFVDRLAMGLARIACVFYPLPAVIRLSDFKTNEYANLIGGNQFEPKEENPMLGFRGASRYYSPRYEEGFALECRALRKLRTHMGFKNCIVMIPFCRTVQEAIEVINTMAKYDLRRGQDGLELYMMCEVPSNVIQAREFARHFDGFSIGSNDLTQLTLGIDRDSTELAPLFDERNDSIKWMIEHVIKEAKQAGVKIGICGQAPSDHPEFAEFLVRSGINSISVTPDSYFDVKRKVAETESILAGKSRDV